MKNNLKSLLFICAMTLTLTASAEWEHRTITWQDTTREYIVVYPAQFNAEQPTGTLFFLHGLFNYIDSLIYRFDWQHLADMSGWVCVLPQALEYQDTLGLTPVNLGPCWNSGVDVDLLGATYPLSGDVDDSGFLMALLDTLSTQYNLNSDSVFFAGMSMGGFMTNRMAIEHGDRITAAVPISGLIALKFAYTEPVAPINMMCIHGTDDPIVTYYGDFISFTGLSSIVASVGLGAEETVEFWRSYNECSYFPTIDIFENRKKDGLLFIRYSYTDGIDGKRVSFICVRGGTHQIYGDPDVTDIDYLTEIYNFCSGNNVGYPPSSREPYNSLHIYTYPNPATDNITVKVPSYGTLDITNYLGEHLLSVTAKEGDNRINVSSLPAGIYCVRFSDGVQYIGQKFVIAR